MQEIPVRSTSGTPLSPSYPLSDSMFRHYKGHVHPPSGDLREQDLVAVPKQAPGAGRQLRGAAVRPVVQQLQQGRPGEALLLRLVHHLMKRRQQHLNVCPQHWSAMTGIGNLLSVDVLGWQEISKLVSWPMVQLLSCEQAAGLLP